MRLMYLGKDGGPESKVWGFWFIELKNYFSIALLKFVGVSREAFHTHAFNSVSWVLWGSLMETVQDDFRLLPDKDAEYNVYYPSLKPVITKRDTMHKVDSRGTTYVLTFRGPWTTSWKEYIPPQDQTVILTNGRVEV